MFTSSAKRHGTYTALMMMMMMMMMVTKIKGHKKTKSQ
jgi:hypothetical protein